MKRTVILLYGLLDSGKTTVGRALHKALPHSVFIDADDMRKYSGNYDYGEVGRRENIFKTSDFINVIQGEGVIILAFDAPTRELRDVFIENNGAIPICCNADLATCRNRDTRGLYDKAGRGDATIPMVGVEFDTTNTEHFVATCDFKGMSPDDVVEIAVSDIIEKIIKPRYQDYEI